MPVAPRSLIPHSFSFLALAVLAVIFLASVWVFTELVRRETSHRRRSALAQWAPSRGLHLADSTTAIDAAGDLLTPLAAFNPKIQLLIHGSTIALVQVEARNSAASAPANTAPLWHLLIYRLEQDWPPTALRPTSHTFSIIDLFGMSSFPSLSSTQRFVVFGQDAAAAEKISRTVPALLPPDIGLLLHGHCMILDFTPRQFDEIEFARMIELAEQLVAGIKR